jgi:hypothetical protein
MMATKRSKASLYAVQYQNYKPTDFFPSRAKALEDIRSRTKRYYTLRGDYKVVCYERKGKP